MPVKVIREKKKELHPKMIARTWQKGQSGNPGGRPKMPVDLRQLTQDHTPEAIHRIIEHMRSTDPRISLHACEILLDRAWGKPAQMVVSDQTRRFVVEMPLQAMSEEQWLKTIQPASPKTIDHQPPPSGDPSPDKPSS